MGRLKYKLGRSQLLFRRFGKEHKLTAVLIVWVLITAVLLSFYSAAFPNQVALAVSDDAYDQKPSASFQSWSKMVATQTATATSTTRPVPGILPPSDILGRLTTGKTGIWANPGIYVLVGLFYLALFGLLVREILADP